MALLREGEMHYADRTWWALFLERFLDSDQDEIEVVYLQPGETISGRKVVEAGMSEMTLYRMLRNIMVERGWYKQVLWLQKRGNTYRVTKFDPKNPK